MSKVRWTSNNIFTWEIIFLSLYAPSNMITVKAASDIATWTRWSLACCVLVPLRQHFTWQEITKNIYKNTQFIINCCQIEISRELLHTNVLRITANNCFNLLLSAGFMMEMASWDGGISRTVQFLVPKVRGERPLPPRRVFCLKTLCRDDALSSFRALNLS